MHPSAAHRRVGVLLTALLCLALVVAVPGRATAEDPAVLNASKTASVATAELGQTLTFTVQTGCTTNAPGCTNATVTDVVPDAFEVVSAEVVGTAGTATVDGQTVTAAYTTPLADPPGAQGLPAGQTGTVVISVRLREDLPYEADGVPVTNTADYTATNPGTAPATASATVTPDVEPVLAATVGKSVAPDGALAVPGTPLTVTLTAGNTSNAGVDSLTVVDPGDPPGDPNPFGLLAVTGVGAVTFPPAADLVQVDIWDGTQWMTGTPATAAALPAGVDPAGAQGVRLTFTSSTGAPIDAGAEAGVELQLEQRPGVAGLDEVTTVVNTASSSVALDGATAAAGPAQDTYVLTPVDVQAAAGKTFDPDAVTAGNASTVTLTGTNAGTAADAMTITEPAPGSPNPFGAGLTFTGVGTDGAGAGVVWPEAATSLSVTYTYADGSTETLSTTDPGGFPAPTGEVAGFSATFSGPIAAGATATVPFTVATDPDQTVESVVRSNQAQVVVTADGVDSDPATASADLTTYAERVAVTTGKAITPGTIPAAAGQPVVVQLPTQLAPFPASTVPATTIVVQDPQTVPPDPAPDPWWDAFDATAITQTAVPAGATLDISYWSESQQAWVPLPGGQGIAGPAVVSIPVPAGLQDDIGGLRFSYEDPSGFPPGTTVQPNVTSTLRPDSRSAGTPLPNAAQSVTDCASATASAGDLDAPPQSACAAVDLTPTTPGEGDLIAKQFLEPEPGAGATVTARSADEIDALLSWSTGGYAGLDEVTISDVPDPGSTPVGASFYDAFDAVAVAPITAADDPWLTYDEVASVELWDGTGWVRAAADPCPAACDGTFPGVTLTAAEQAAATSVRLVFTESPTRADRIGTDPTAPQVGTGVARSSADDRELRLTFRLRDERRSDGQPVLGTTSGTIYNVGVGVVLDVAGAVGTTDGTEVVRDGASDTVTILDVPLNVGITKQWAGGPLGIPPAGTDPGAYPSGRVTVTATNVTAANVDRLLIRDPVVPGGPGDPSEVVDVLDIVQVSVPEGATGTVVTLARAGAAPTTHTPAEAEALDAAALADVVGITVDHTGRVEAGADAVLVLDTRLRATHRTDGTPVTTADSPVLDRAQALVEDLGGDVPGAQPTATADATVDLVASDITVAATKGFVPDVLVEPATGPVTVMIGGQPGGSARTVSMVLTDDDPRFWNQYDLTGFAAAAALTAPIDRVQVDALVGGTFTAGPGGVAAAGGTWVEGEPEEAFALPGGVTAGEVQGLRFTFTGADGAIWENPADPLQQVPLLMERRDELRSGGPVPSDLAGTDPAPGETAPGVATDTVQAEVTGAVLVGGDPVTASDEAEAAIRFQHATSGVLISKAANGASGGTQVAPATPFPYTIAVTNTGDWPVTDPVVVDRLPVDAGGPQLVLPEAYPGGDGAFTYALVGDAPPEPNGPPMPVDPDDVAVAVAGDVEQLTFTFPPGTVLEPGQTYTITAQLMLRPGLAGGTTVTNTAGVTGDRPWDTCDPALDPGTGECRASASVVALSAGALRSEKLVRADGPDLGVLATSPGATCTPDADGFFASPCVPRSAPGTLETWRVRVTNTGNLPMDRLRVGDELPRPGDTGIGNPQPRDSRWQPLFEGTPVVVETETGFTGTLSWTQDEQPCIDPTGCAPGAWTAFTGTEPQDLLDSISGLLLDGTFAAGQALDPLESISFEFTTRTPASSPAPGADPVAYNSVGSTARAVDGGTSTWLLPTEGQKVGVALATGGLQVSKVVTGPGAGNAPATFPLTLACTSAVGTRLEAEVPLGDAADLAVTPVEPVTVTDLPWGAQCTVTEDTGATGASGFTATTVTVADDADAGVVVATNTYDTAGLQVRKQVESAAVDQDGTPVAYGPFQVTVSCTFLGEPVYADGYGPGDPMVVALADGQTVTLDGLPVGAACAVTETDTQGGDPTSTVVQGGSAPVVVDGATAELVVVPDAADGSAGTTDVIANAFGTGSLVIDKQVDGPGADAFGAGPFAFAVTCTLTDASGTRTVYEGDVVVARPSLTATVPDLAVGAVCDVVETGEGGATTTTVTGSPATVGADQPVTVTATNTYELGSLQVVKEVDGDGADRYGAGPFEVELACTLDGRPVPVPGGAVRPLAPGQPATYDGLPVRALCTATETADGGATSTRVAVGAGVGPAVVEAGDGDAITVTNTFDTGEVRVLKRLDGPDAATAQGDAFTVELACTRLVDGVRVPVDVPGGASRTLAAATGWAAVYSDLPAGATCVLTETDHGDAGVVRIVVDDEATTTLPSAAVPASVGFAVDGPDACVPVDVVNTFGAVSGAGGGPGRLGAVTLPGLAGPGAAATACDPPVSGVLSRTGADAAPLALLGLGMLLAGAAAVRIRRARSA